MGALAWAAYARLMNLPERPLSWLQGRLAGGRMGWLFVAPNLAVFAVFTFLPIAFNIYYAVTGGTALIPGQRPYAGGENFAELLACQNHFDPATCTTDLFWFGVWNTLKFVVLQVGLMVVFSLITALAMNQKIRGRGFFRAAFFYPVLLSPVVVALIWKWILARDGVLNAALQGVGASPVNWLLEAHTAFGWTVFVSIWAHMGFYTLILLAGLQAIPADLYEAAAMDATPPWRVFRRITLPLLMPSLLVVIVLALIRAVQIFDEVYVLTGGGPGSATTYLVQFIYSTGFAQQVRQYGLASAASLLLAGVLMALTLLQLSLMRRSRG
ncbi:MAG TPA: sugar ABC transporter permease [Acetobacteraceae bacterium]|nr:sugar ABC transporter permease [Acetobacteraceae bacterium]